MDRAKTRGECMAGLGATYQLIGSNEGSDLHYPVSFANFSMA